MTTELWILIGACAFVLLLFVASLLVPRNVRPARSADGMNDDFARRFDDLDRRVGTAEHDVRNIRMAVGGLATKDSVNALALQVANMGGEVKTMAAQVATTAHSVGRVEDFLIRSSADAIAGSKGTEGKG